MVGDFSTTKTMLLRMKLLLEELGRRLILGVF